MRIAFGLLSLVVVLAIVGLSAKRSLQASGAPVATVGASAAPTPQQVTRKAADDLNASMQQAASRAESADR